MGQGMTDLQFKNDLRKELNMYTQYMELLEKGDIEELKKRFQAEILRIQASLQD